jgi:hypothetical protein
MRWVVMILFFLPVLAFAQDAQVQATPAEDLSYYLATFSETDGSEVRTEAFMDFVHKLEHKRTSCKDDQAFLRLVFSKTHQQFLRNYQDYAAFSTLLNKGTYNCLTGTALYALLLNHFEIEYEVIETNYHIFLLASTAKGRILFEATDPSHGFVEDAAQIEKRLAEYKGNDVQEKRSDKTYYRLTCSLYKPVSLEEMTGLLHYNLAIEAYNNNQLHVSITHLDKAAEVYHSQRMEELTRIILLSVIESKLDVAVKESCIKRIQTVRKRNTMALASAGDR